MSNETSKNLKVVSDERVFTAKVLKTIRDQYVVQRCTDDSKQKEYLGPDGWDGMEIYAYPDVESAEQALAEWKVKNIPWLTREQVRACAKESDLAAVECSIIHWKQIKAVGRVGYRIASELHLTSFAFEHCALSHRVCVNRENRTHCQFDGMCHAEYDLFLTALSRDGDFDSATAAMIVHLEKAKEELLAKDKPETWIECHDSLAGSPSMPETTPESCQTCRFFLDLSGTSVMFGGDGGFCRRNAPRKDCRFDLERGAHPAVLLDWWCGEYECKP